MAFVARTSTATAALAGVRAFGSTSSAQKSAAETIKQTLKSADKAVASKIVDGIEVGEAATRKVKEVAGDVKVKAEEMKGGTKDKASEVTHKAKEKGEEIKRKT